MIVKSRGVNQEVQSRAFALTDMVSYGYTGLRSQGGTNEQAIHGIPAMHRAVRLRSEAIGSLRFCCWRDNEEPNGDIVPSKVTNVWQARFFEKAPNEYQTRFRYWESVEESICWRGNSYSWKLVDPMTGRVIALYALHPDQVICKGDGRYDVTVASGFVDPVGRGPGVYKDLDENTILHINGFGDGGKYEAPSPIKLFRETFASALERQRHETSMWSRGTAMRLAVEFPQGVSQAQAEEWRKMWKKTYEGDSGETTAIVGAGGQIKPISMTAEDAAFVSMAGLTVDDAARIMAVPRNLLGVYERGAQLEQDLATWLRFSIGPECERIESAFSNDDDLFGSSPPAASSVYPRFDTEDFIRGDLKTEALIVVSLVQAGIITPNEGRRLRGLDDIGPEGDILQITPVGGAPNPLLAPEPAPVADPSTNGVGGY